MFHFPRRVKASGRSAPYSADVDCLARPHPAFIGNRRLRFVQGSYGKIRTKMSSFRTSKDTSSKSNLISHCVHDCSSPAQVVFQVL